MCSGSVDEGGTWSYNKALASPDLKLFRGKGALWVYGFFPTPVPVWMQPSMLFRSLKISLSVSQWDFRPCRSPSPISAQTQIKSFYMLQVLRCLICMYEYKLIYPLLFFKWEECRLGTVRLSSSCSFSYCFLDRFCCYYFIFSEFWVRNMLNMGNTCFLYIGCLSQNS